MGFLLLASVVAEIWALGAGSSSCDSRAQKVGLIVMVSGISSSVACGIFLDPGIEPVSPALTGGS